MFLGFIPQVVFDEVHFGKFISSYCCTHTRFFDIHPPVGKLLIAAGAAMSGYDGLFPFENIGQPYGLVPIAAMRLVPAIAGALLPVIIFLILRRLDVSFVFSVIGGAAIALDNGLIVESRFILTDSILLSSIFGAILFAISAVQTGSRRLAWAYVAAAGILSGVAVGTKFTGMVAAVLVAIIFLSRPYRFRRILFAACLAAAVYIGGWWLHFALLTLPGSGDVWGVPTGNFFRDIITAHQQMLSANYNLTAGHPYGSTWWTWPFMVRPISYWQGGGSQFIYFLGNPAVWWGSFIAFVGCVYTILFSFINKQRIDIRSSGEKFIWVFILGYFWAYVPLMRVPRVLFLYHYLTPLICSLVVAIWYVDRHTREKMPVACALLALFVAGFLAISPLTYGYTIPTWWQSILFSIPTWR